MNAPLPDKPVPALGYDVLPPEGYVSRRKYRFLVMLTVCNTLLLVALVGGPVVWGVAREARARQAAAVAQAQAAQAQAAAAQAQAARAQLASARRTALQQQQQVQQVSQAQIERDVRQRASDRLLSHTRPSEQTVYEEDPVAASKMLPSSGAAGGRYRALGMNNVDSRYASSFQPPVILQDVSPSPPFHSNDNDRCILFVHGLTSAGGNKRIVMLDLKVISSGGSRQRAKGQEYEIRLERQLYYRIFTPADASSSREAALAREGPSLQVRTNGGDAFPVTWVDGVLRADRPGGKSLRFYAGQADGNDPSHFTIDYDFAGERGAIDGWLTDDDFLRIRPRGGEVEGGTWYVNGKAEGAK
jgi:hypothetical protein